MNGFYDSFAMDIIVSYSNQLLSSQADKIIVQGLQ